MVRTATATAKKPATTAKKCGRKKGTVTAQFNALQSKKAAIREEFSKGRRTKAAYTGYLNRGRDILVHIVKERRLKEKTTRGWKCPEGIDTGLLEKAFEGPPNKHSAMALELYLTQKCVVEGRGKSTAEGIHGAFADYWDNLQGGKYAGDYSYDGETGKVTGCPARVPEIEAFMKCIKSKSRVKGEAATRRHAEATTIEDMRKMMGWSESQCIAEESKKNFELCQLQERDLTPGARGPAPYYLSFIGVFLNNRKGWQQKQGYDGPLACNHYDIYEQPDTPEICMFSHLTIWRKIYRQRLDRNFEPDDYVFPYISPNGTIHPKKPLSHDLVQDYINEFASGASINKIFTTHCLRRGGSQYRFMFAAIGKRWSLSIIRWWGGWAEGEQVDTLMRYLLDSLQSYESGHGDALNPHRLEMDKSFMGDHDVLKAPTVGEFRTLSDKILTKLNNFSTQIHCTHLPPAHGATTAGSMAEAFNLMSLPPVTALSTSNPSPVIFVQPTIWSQPSPHHHPNPAPQSDAATLPLPGISVPSVGKDAMAWRRAVDQWELGTLYSNRKLLAMEYRRLGSDDTVFMGTYPEHGNITQLLAAIRRNSGRTRSSRGYQLQ
ncbi:hypothetical protein B0H13DRAFT_1867987 [Mycena leptocephala]|nr:hypothetical protein B0H13DRAFT_1867987 [Mycena leptocephala]